MCIKEAFRYIPETGELIRLVRQGNYQPNTVCSARTACGRYLKVGYKGKAVLIHRLAWELYYGEPAPECIDHINGNGLDNRITNLRAADNSKNQMNTGVTVKNRLGKKGIFPVRGGKMFRAEVCVGGRRYQKHSVDVAVLESWVRTQRQIHHGDFAKH